LEEELRMLEERPRMPMVHIKNNSIPRQGLKLKMLAWMKKRRHC